MDYSRHKNVFDEINNRPVSTKQSQKKQIKSTGLEIKTREHRYLLPTFLLFYKNALM